MTNEECTRLNEKILKFCGFKFVKGDNDVTKMITTVDHYICPNGKIIHKQIDLVNDANAQIKWIYPKLKEGQCYITKKHSYESNDFSIFIYRLSKPPIESVRQKSEALALALAVEKYIDNLEGK